MQTKPNFIVFVTDDQGYGDLSCMGCSDFRTPNLDQLASEGTRFTSWYANGAVCSPTRASIMSGRYPANSGVRAVLKGHRTATGLPPHVPSIAKALKKEGYRTYLSGKWHIGMSEESRPHSHGFDHSYGFLAGCIDYYSHIFYWGMNKPGPGKNPTHDLWEDNREVWNNGKYFTEAITEKAVDYLRDAAASDEPFFLFVGYNAPHYPMHAPSHLMDRFSHLPWDRQVMAAMLSGVDDGIGEIMNELKRLGVEDNTISFFMSDNGPSRESRNWLDGTMDPYYGGSSGGLKGHKSSLFEGGIRVPAIMHAPGRIPAGQVLDQPCLGMDIFPTALNAAGGDPAEYELDGEDIMPYVAEGKALPERDLFWELRKQTAIRRGKWKLVLNGQLEEDVPDEDKVHLADLETDMAESTNLADAHPDITNELRERAETWRASIEKRWEEEFSEEKQGTVTHS